MMPPGCFRHRGRWQVEQRSLRLRLDSGQGKSEKSAQNRTEVGRVCIFRALDCLAIRCCPASLRRIIAGSSYRRNFGHRGRRASPLRGLGRRPLDGSSHTQPDARLLVAPQRLTTRQVPSTSMACSRWVVRRAPTPSDDIHAHAHAPYFAGKKNCFVIPYKS